TGDPTSGPRTEQAEIGAAGLPLPALADMPDRPSQGDPLLFVRCFGSLQVRSGERDVSCMHQYQAWELLAYLVTHGGSVTRQEVFDTFWPQVEGAVVGNRLDRLVFRLKKVLTAQAGEGARDILSREQGKLALDAAVLTSDLQRFHALLQ